MSIKIACSQSGCTNPVIGQCTGHKKTCGRYYCHEHSIDTLCSDCANQKIADEKTEAEQKLAKERAEAIYQEYLKLAEKVSKEHIPIPAFRFQANKLLILGGLSFIVGAILFCLTILGVLTLPENIVMGSISELWQKLLAYVMCGSFILAGWPIGVIPLAWLSAQQSWVSQERQKKIVERVTTIEQEKKGFTKFWNAWVKQQNQERTEKNKQILMGVLTVVGVIAAGAVGATLSESDYDRTRRAVRDEMNRQ
ncbi:MAG: hypothetical protein CVU44_20875 [Chloroflexi bacterium HGW-Chloroflexi-6]|nr:MAG: hypothetical protein CVU44_20875 [Chloroflexi bacterium HGW-Chloroflexi-6]